MKDLDELRREMNQLLTQTFSLGCIKGYNDCKSDMRYEGKLHQNPGFYQLKLKEAYEEGYQDGWNEGLEGKEGIELPKHLAHEVVIKSISGIEEEE